MIGAQNAPGRGLHLVEVNGCVYPDDPRLTALAEKAQETGIEVHAIGGYAVPLSSAALEF